MTEQRLTRCHFTLGQKYITKLARLAALLGVSRSEMIRRLIDEATKKGGKIQ